MRSSGYVRGEIGKVTSKYIKEVTERKVYWFVCLNLYIYVMYTVYPPCK